MGHAADVGQRILIVRTSALGDVVHCLPVLTALRRHLPGARLGWVVEEAMAPLLEGHPDLDELFVARLRPWRRAPFAPRTLREIGRFVGALERFAAEVVLDLMGNHKGGILAALTFADRRLGLERRARREPSSAVWISEPVPARGEHAVERALSVLDGLGLPREPPDFGGEKLFRPSAGLGLRLEAPECSGGKLLRSGAERADSGVPGESGARLAGPTGGPRREEFRSSRDLAPAHPNTGAVAHRRAFAEGTAPPTAARSADPDAGSAAPGAGEPFAAILPGAAWGNKRYPPERWGKLARLLREATGLPSRIAAGPHEDALAREVERTSGGAAVAVPAPTLPQLAALLRAANLVLGGDTGPLHLAHALGRPVVCVMGPTDPGASGPYGAPGAALWHALPCSFCYKRMDEAKACLLAIRPEDVAARAREILARHVAA